MSDLIFGTSGWSYKEWIGPFYKRAKNMFSFYAQFFNTSEINSTFYRYPSESMIHGLERNSSPDFVFSAKLPRLITHEKRLDPDRNVKNDLIRFLKLLEPLDARNKLGCILIQLPPSFEYERDLEKFEIFLDMIPNGYEFATEFRNASWLRKETWTLLSKFNVAYCIVDEPLLPPEVHLTADFAYFRWHGKNFRPWYDYHYSKEELEKWVPRVLSVKDHVGKVYGYFNNHFHGYAIENCIEILQMLEGSKPNHEKIKAQIIHYNMKKRLMTRERKLEDFGFKLSEGVSD